MCDCNIEKSVCEVCTAETHWRWHCCVFDLVTILTDTCIEQYSQLGENLVQATWHCSIPSSESIQADQRAGLKFTLQHNNFEHLTITHFKNCWLDIGQMAG